MPTRFPGGLNTSAKDSTLWQGFGLPDPTKWHVFWDDFVKYTAGDWTITTTEAGAGSATEALTNVAFGNLLITNDAADNDADFFQNKQEGFLMTSNKRTLFKTRFKVSDATQSDIVIGLQITDTAPLAVSDGVYFMKDDGDALIDFHVEKNSTDTTATSAGTLVDDTFIVLGFDYDGANAIRYFVDDVHVGTSVTTNVPDDEELTISFGIQNGEAVAKTMTLDYIFAAQER